MYVWSSILPTYYIINYLPSCTYALTPSLPVRLSIPQLNLPELLYNVVIR